VEHNSSVVMQQSLVDEVRHHFRTSATNPQFVM